MRVTNSMVLRSTLNDLNGSLARLQRDQTELATGRRIRTVSDDPTGASSAMTVRSQLRRAEQYERVADDSQGWLGTADTAIVAGLDLMGRVKELAVRAGNDGTTTPTTRQTLATEVEHLREELRSLANTEYLDRPVFNGTAAGDAYDAAGTYLGNDAKVTRQLGPGTTLDVNLTGPEVFGDPASPQGDVFAVLDRLATAIAAGDRAAVATEHANVDDAMSTMSAAAAQIGSRGARLEGIRDRLSADMVTMRQALSEIEDADLAEAMISVKASENAYTASLQAAAQVLPPSLVDYMR
jgi:flagellar hook-associated protein 3 FlgL